MRRRILLCLVLSSWIGLAVFGQQTADPPMPFVGKVVGIADGDTITVLLAKQQHKIRLNGIDAPESGQAFGTKSKQALGDMVFGKEVKIEWKERDKYKRIIGEVFVGDCRVCLAMVQEGFAWHYVQYSKDPAIAKAEKEARDAKKGLWADAKPIPPWEYRKGNTDMPDVIFITEKGTKYHRDGCRFLNKSKIAISLDDARKRFEPCSICKPPSTSKT